MLVIHLIENRLLQREMFLPLMVVCVPAHTRDIFSDSMEASERLKQVLMGTFSGQVRNGTSPDSDLFFVFLLFKYSLWTKILWLK